MPFNEEYSNRQSTRHPFFDYRQAGYYFVTICVHERQHLFGKVENGHVILSTAGQIAQQQWLQLEDRFPGVKLDAFVIMPNHVHGIVIIPQRTNMDNVPDVFKPRMQQLVEQRHPELNQPYRPPALGGDIMRAYKAATSRLVRLSGLTTFAWQRNFHDQILLANAKLIQQKRNYIINNPAKWSEDEFYT
jgi:REP element-mobilizing transposase RayT